MQEIWKDIPGYEGLYEASNQGRIRKLAYIQYKKYNNGVFGANINGKNIRAKKNNRGYWQVRLYKDGQTFNYLVHRLIAMTFIENVNIMPQVNHKDENKDNNRADNLEWCDNLYNRHYGTGIERMAKNHDYKKIAQVNSRPVIQFDKNGKIIKKWPSVVSASRHYGCSDSSIRCCCYGKSQSTLGYIWKYEHDISVVS